jgi:hypothetical protein
MSVRLFVRAAAAVLFVVVLQLATAAGARVVVDTVVPRGDGSVDLVLSLSGSCAGGATVGLVATLPEGAAVVAVADPQGWSHAVDGTEVTWTGPAARAGATYSVTARIDAAPGDEVEVPATQRCAAGGEVASVPTFVATASTVDPGLRPVADSADPSGAGPMGVGIAVVAFAGLAAAGAVVRRRRGAA